MAGKLWDGRDLTEAKNGVKNNSTAYCEGMFYRASDTAINHPKANNPHQVGSEAARAWDLGWDAANAQAGGFVGKDALGPCGGMPQIPS